VPERVEKLRENVMATAQQTFDGGVIGPFNQTSTTKFHSAGV